MRYVIYILLLMNVGYFAWSMQHTVPRLDEAHHVGHASNKLRRLETIDEKAVTDGNSTDETPASAKPVRDTGSELGPAAITQVEVLTKSEPPGAVDSASSCHALGPFRNDQDMKAVRDRLNRLGYKSRESRGQVRVEVGYWVYLPPMERDEMIRITKRLDERNDPDYLVLKDNALSLGAYDNRSRADARLKMLRQYGLDPVVEPRYAMRTAYWLDLEVPVAAHSVLSAVRSESQSIEAQESACL